MGSANLQKLEYVVCGALYIRNHHLRGSIATTDAAMVMIRGADDLALLEDLNGKGHSTKFPESTEENLILATKLPDND